MKTPDPNPNHARDALERYRERFAAVRQQDLIDITTDVPKAAMTVTGVLPFVAHLAPRFGTLPKQELHPLGLPDGPLESDFMTDLRGIADATLQAHARYVADITVAGELQGTFKQASALRKRLSASSKPLVEAGLLPAGSLSGLANKTGYRNVAVDLTALSTLLEDHWSTIANKTTLSVQDLESAALLAQELFSRASGRQTHDTHAAAAALLRARAFTVLYRAYENLRRCVAFLEPNEASALTPSLYKGRGRRNARVKVEGVPSFVEN